MFLFSLGTSHILDSSVKGDYSRNNYVTTIYIFISHFVFFYESPLINICNIPKIRVNFLIFQNQSRDRNCLQNIVFKSNNQNPSIPKIQNHKTRRICTITHSSNRGHLKYLKHKTKTVSNKLSAFPQNTTTQIYIIYNHACWVQSIIRMEYPRVHNHRAGLPPTRLVIRLEYLGPLSHQNGIPICNGSTQS